MPFVRVQGRAVIADDVRISPPAVGKVLCNLDKDTSRYWSPDSGEEVARRLNELLFRLLREVPLAPLQVPPVNHSDSLVVHTFVEHAAVPSPFLSCPQ